jgi:hypothetical protein
MKIRQIYGGKHINYPLDIFVSNSWLDITHVFTKILNFIDDSVSIHCIHKTYMGLEIHFTIWFIHIRLRIHVYQRYRSKSDSKIHILGLVRKLWMQVLGLVGKKRGRQDLSFKTSTIFRVSALTSNKGDNLLPPCYRTILVSF